MHRLLALFLGVLALLGAAAWWVKFEHQAPRASWGNEAPVVGRRAVWDIDVQAPGWPGLRRVEVLLASSGPSFQLFEREYPPVNWIGSRIGREAVHIEADLLDLKVPEGEARLQVFAETYAWKITAPRRRLLEERQVEIDLTPPRTELLSIQHNIRLGGSSVAVFRVSPDTERAGVAVADYFFPAKLGYFADPAVAVAIFAVPQDLTADAQPQIFVRDAVGNSRSVALPSRIRNRKFPERTLNIDDRFLERKVPELVSANALPPQPDLVKGYLYINGDFRRETERRLREITASSADRPLWDGAFRRQSNAAPMSAFADRRIYLYQGAPIDRQTHLGYDLASLEGAAVEATQNGIVVFAGNLGIYGDTVIIDHGLGVFSLYGHLRSIAVQSGQKVVSGEIIGQTGETGLAGGDHLHYSIMLHGIHVDPVEWWDSKWIRDHVTAKLTMLPSAASVLSAAAPAAEPLEPANGQAQP